MYIGIVSDLHGNAAAWRAVSSSLQGVDQILCLGDMVGYGPNSIECLQPALDGRFTRWIRGNHEEGWWVLRNLLKPGYEANGRQRLLDRWTQTYSLWQSPETRLEAAALVNTLAESIVKNSEDDRDAILPLQYRTGLNARSVAISSWMHFELELCNETKGEVFHQMVDHPDHSAPQTWETDGLRLYMTHETDGGYLYPWASPDSIERVAKTLPAGKPSVYLFGHSHIPMYAPIDDGNMQSHDPAYIAYGSWLPLGNTITLINPGSVGWGRDGDQRPAYAVLDTTNRMVCYCRIESGYDVSETVLALAERGFPNKLISEVAQGSIGISSSEPRRAYAVELLEKRKQLVGGVCP